MTFTTATVRALGALSAGMLALGMLAACASAPEPTPTKTALFSSDAEAFKAAEETYRAYTEALNEVDTSDPETFERVLMWSTGEAASALKKSLSELHAEEVTLTGATIITSASARTADPDSGDVSMHICADVSETDVIDASGKSLVSSERAPVQSLLVDFAPGGTSTGLRVASTTGDETPCSL